MPFEIYSQEKIVVCVYEPVNGVDWIIKEFNSGDTLKVKGTFLLSQEMLLEEIDLESGKAVFKIGEIKDGYYILNKEVFETKHDIYINANIPLSTNLFVVNTNISIFRKIDKLTKSRITLEPNESEFKYNNNVITMNVFYDILKRFPSTTEINHYKNSRITNILKQYFEVVVDSELKLENIQNKKNRTNYVDDKQNNNILEVIKANELDKYIAIYDLLRNMIINLSGYTEKQWQIEIIKILKFIFPKYIYIIPELIIFDYYTKRTTTKRKVDFVLVSSDGYVDIIEIKKPMTNSLIAKSEYRGNYTPVKELSGTIMQVEKYIFHLNKWGLEGEKHINKSHQNKINNISIKIANPKGIILIGIEENLNKNQMFDFEIIKRKYSNIMDIITYDELLRRIENQINTIDPSYKIKKIYLQK